MQALNETKTVKSNKTMSDHMLCTGKMITVDLTDLFFFIKTGGCISVHLAGVVAFVETFSANVNEQLSEESFYLQDVTPAMTSSSSSELPTV